MLLAPLVLLAVAATMLVVASSAPALNTDASAYSIQKDDLGANDEPGQKDLTLQGTNTTDFPTKINVLWNWDDTSVGGGNTLDACTLFDSDTSGPGLGNADFSFCAIVGNVSSSNKTLELKSTVLYTCGDTRNDRCASQIAAVANPSSDTTCGGLNASSNTNPFTPPNNPDTRIFCTVVLQDVGATTASLINTCSYPSQQPNSDPSDCVLVPGKANPTIATTPTLIPQDSAALTGQSGTGGSVTFQLYIDDGDATTCEAEELVFEQTDSSSTYATNNDGTPDANTKNGYTITSDGLYLWKVSYSGDGSNNPANQACGTESFNVNVEPNPS